MDDLGAIGFILCFIGFTVFMIGVYYGKKFHESWPIDLNLTSFDSGFSFIRTPLLILLDVFFMMGPWWLTKSVLLLSGLAIMVMGLAV